MSAANPLIFLDPKSAPRVATPAPTPVYTVPGIGDNHRVAKGLPPCFS
jgi:hypothetical protein